MKNLLVCIVDFSVFITHVAILMKLNRVLACDKYDDSDDT